MKFNKRTASVIAVAFLFVGGGTAAVTGFNLLDTTTTQATVEEPMDVQKQTSLRDTVTPGAYYGKDSPHYVVTNSQDGQTYTMAVRVEVTKEEAEEYLANLGISITSETNVEGEPVGTAFRFFDQYEGNNPGGSSLRKVESFDTDEQTYVELKQKIQPGQTYDVYPSYEIASDAPSNADGLDFDVEIARE